MHIWKKLKEKKGETMVEVLVAFAVVLIALASLSAGVATAVKLARRSAELLTREDELDRAYYQWDREEAAGEELTLVLHPKRGRDITLKVEKKTFLDPSGGKKRYVITGED